MRRLLSLALLLLLGASLVAGFGSRCGSDPSLNGNRYSRPRLTPEQAVRLSTPSQPERNLKVAFVGDVGNKDHSRRALGVARSWGASAVVIGGDFDYKDEPEAWIQLLDDTLGNIPVFATMGNHDMLTWGPDMPWDQGGGYRNRMRDRLRRTRADTSCVGLGDDEFGVKTVCNWRGLQLVLSAVGTWGLDHDAWADEVLGSTQAMWRVCDFHKVQHAFQLGLKLDETGWGIYQTCLKHGAILATHHEHSYGRTKNMADFKDKRVANEDKLLVVKPGQSFAFVSGLGGFQVRPHHGNEQLPHWASYAAQQQGIRAAVLLCEFHINGDPRAARCDYVDPDSKRWDSWEMRSENRVSPAFSPSNQYHNNNNTGMAPAACEYPFVELAVASGLGDITVVPPPAQELIQNAVSGAPATLQVLGTAQPRLEVRRDQAVLLRFPSLREEAARGRWAPRLLGLDRLRAAHLQLKGIRGSGAASLSIRLASLAEEPQIGLTDTLEMSPAGEFSPAASGFGAQVPADGRLQLSWVGQRTVQWQLVDGDLDWETGDVWVSPDLAPLLRELPADGAWQRQGLVALVSLSTPEELSQDTFVMGERPLREFHSFDSSACLAPTLTLEFEESCL